VHLEKNERPTHVIHTYRKAGASLHLEVTVTRGPEQRAYTGRAGKERYEATTQAPNSQGIAESDQPDQR
jgi:hypothetical protein